MRIVSLLPSATEIVCALGEERALVGRSCRVRFPPVDPDPARGHAAQGRGLRSPVLGDRRPGPSGAFEGREPVLPRPRSLADVAPGPPHHPGPLLGLLRDRIGGRPGACRSAGISPRVLSLSPRTLSEVRASILDVGAAIGRTEEAKALVRELPAAEASVDRRDLGVPANVAVVEWGDPPILPGLWTKGMVEAAGGRSVGPGDGEVGERTTWPEIDRRKPDLVVVSPCSFGVARTRRELLEAPGARGWDRRTLPLGRWIADEAFFSRPGPRLAEGVALIRSLLTGAAPSVSLSFERWVERGDIS